MLVGHCYDLREAPPYGLWTDLLDRLPPRPGLPPLPLLVGAPGGEAAGQAARFARLRDFLLALARPDAGRGTALLLLLEDLHWADPASLDLLRFLARALDRAPLLLLATYRAEEVGRAHPLYALLPALVREARAARLDLRPLGDDGLRALVRGRYALDGWAEARLVAYLHERSEGNPFFVGELLRALEAAGMLRREAARWRLGTLAHTRVPTLLRQVLDGRLARLGAEAYGLLAVAAVIGQTVSLPLWAAASGADEGALAGALERALGASVLEEAPDGRGVRFAHALIREALYEGLSLPGRGRLHARIADTLLATPAPDPDAVAYHLRRAGDPRAAAWLVLAGERARRAYAWLTAAERYAAALALLETQGAPAGERGWLTLRLARLHYYADAPLALGHAETAAHLAGAASDPLLAALATFLAGSLHCLLGAVDRGIARMEAGLAALDALPAAARLPPGAAVPLDPASRRGTVVSWLAVVGRYAEALATAGRVPLDAAAPPTTDWFDDSATSDALYGLGLAHAGLGRPAAARAAYSEAREYNRAIGHHQQVGALAEGELGVILRYQADRQADLRHLTDEAVQSFARAGGAAFLAPYTMRLPLLVLNGQWAEVRRLTAALDDLPLSPIPRMLITSRLGPLARAQGDATLAWTQVRTWLPSGPAAAPGDAWFVEAQVFQRLAAALALDGADLPLAALWLDAHDRWLAWSGAVAGRSDSQLLRAAYQRAVGDRAAARDHAARALAHATEPRQPLALLAAHRLSGELDTEAGQHADALAHLDAALALADACAAPYERALTLLALAELRAAEARGAAAARLLAEARATLAALGARPALARADALAARLAAPAPPAPPPAVPFGLTAREVEVLRLVAEGLTDAQVAARLCLSRRTVSQHLRSIYNKLAVPTRTAAARVAVAHGLA